MASIKDIIQKITELLERKKTILVAIDGRGGAGKSTLAKNLHKEFSNLTIVSLDDFYLPQVGLPDLERVLKQVIIPLKNNQTTKYQRYDWGTKKLEEWHKVSQNQIIIFEGMTALHDSIRPNFDLTIWVECPADIAHERGIQRDKNLYKVDTEKDWQNLWIPKEEKYIKEVNPQSKADVVINSTILS